MPSAQYARDISKRNFHSEIELNIFGLDLGKEIWKSNNHWWITGDFELLVDYRAVIASKSSVLRGSFLRQMLFTNIFPYTPEEVIQLHQWIVNITLQ